MTHEIILQKNIKDTSSLKNEYKMKKKEIN